MKYGLTDSEFNFLNENLVLPLKKFQAQVFIFGSRVKGRHKKFSDIDLLYIPDPSSPIHASDVYQIISEIENSQFPYKIDLVNYHELASSYRMNIDSEKVAL